MTLRRVALYGGTFDPVHDGHLAVARELTALFRFDEVLFIPAHVAPHKRAAASSSPASPWHRHAMLALATAGEPGWKVSTVELEAPERPYTVETIARLRTDHGGAGVRLFFVMGADSWAEITTWHEWGRLLAMSDHVVVTRPGYEIEAGHVTEEARARIVDLRGAAGGQAARALEAEDGPKIFFSDAVKLEISSTEVRRAARRGGGQRIPVPGPVADYMEKYGLYTEAYDTERNGA